MGSIHIYDRDKLYEEVWTEAVIVVAKRYAVSDVALHKTCKRLQVPVPPRGYWAKLQAGHKVEKTPLPKLSRDIPQRIYVDKPRKPSVPKDRLTFLPKNEQEKFLEYCDNLQVKDRLTNLHPLIKQDKEVREEQKLRRRERNSLDYLNHDYWYYNSGASYKKLLRINVLPEDLTRAYRLMNSIFWAVEELGGTIQQNELNGVTRVLWLGETVPIRLRSKEHDFILMIEEYRSPRKNWRDTKTKRLESEVGSFAIGIFECAHVLAASRKEKRLEEERRRQWEIEQREREERQRLEKELFRQLQEAAVNWQRAKVIEQYVAELEVVVQKEQDPENRDRLLEYIAWARKKIEWLDPFIALEDPILGKLYDSSDKKSY